LNIPVADCRLCEIPLHSFRKNLLKKRLVKNIIRSYSNSFSDTFPFDLFSNLPIQDGLKERCFMTVKNQNNDLGRLVPYLVGN